MADQTQDLIKALTAAAQRVGQKNDPVQTAWAQNPFGFSRTNPAIGGPFGRTGSEPDVFGAIRGVTGALTADLYAGLSDIEQPEYTILTGAPALGGTNPTSYAGTPVVGTGLLQMRHRSVFSSYFVSTPKIELPTSGGRINRGVTMPLTLVNAPNAEGLVPEWITPNSINTPLGIEMMNLFVNMLRGWEQVLFTGNSTTAPASNPRGFIKAFDGFDRLIKTGYVDLDTGITAPAADSLVLDFNSADATVVTNNFARVLGAVDVNLRNRAMRTGLTPYSYGLAMRPDLFYQLTELYAYQYYSPQAISSTVIRLNDELVVNTRDRMRTGSFLIINGQEIPVYQSDGIAQSLTGTGFKSAVYFIPMTGGTERLTYIEGFDLGNDAARQIMQLVPDQTYTLFNGGLYAVAFNQQNMAFEFQVASRPRLILRAPFLAARIENVGYPAGDAPLNSAIPGEAYYVAGGAYYGSAPTVASGA